MSKIIKTTTGVCPIVCADTYHGPWDYESLFCADEESCTEAGEFVCGDFNREKFVETMLECIQRAINKEEPLKEDGVDAVLVCGMDSPKEYNFRGDYACLNVKVTDDFFERARRKIAAPKNEECVRDYIRRNWRSRSGFISFMPETLEEYLDALDEKPEEELVAGGTLALLWAIDKRDEKKDIYDPYDWSSVTMMAVEYFRMNHSLSEFCTVGNPEKYAKERNLPFIDFRSEIDHIDEQVNEYCALFPKGDDRSERAMEWGRKAKGRVEDFWDRQARLVMEGDGDPDGLKGIAKEWNDALFYGIAS